MLTTQPYGTEIEILELPALELLELFVAVGTELDDVALDKGVALDDCAEESFAEELFV